jgi:hypothetical protein
MNYLKSILGFTRGEEKKSSIDDAMDADFTNLTKAHSWYKNLNLISIPFVFICAQNPQPRSMTLPAEDGNCIGIFSMVR